MDLREQFVKYWKKNQYKTYFWKCCGVEYKIKDLNTAKIVLEKHESKIHKSKRVGTFGFYLK